MSKPKRLDNEIPRRYQWVTDGEDAEPQTFASHAAILVEVTGDLQGEPLVLRGGLISADHPIEVIRSPGIYKIDPVRLLRPDTSKSCVTVTVQGVQ